MRWNKWSLQLYYITHSHGIHLTVNSKECCILEQRTGSLESVARSHESSLDAVITVVHVAVVIFIIIAGLSQAKASNFTDGGWAPFGVRGVWNGAALVFFSYIGFDAVATTAEEVRYWECLDVLYSKPIAFRWVLTILIFGGC